ncbi:TetR/AcrR family transcriptional regulator [Mucisphaera sp.]|uniref:TetR/AcrR family transcriptional regulator n=1 Tax=Mucisphaera sp. TaxID=2913024 RepID=UPI003D10023E
MSRKQREIAAREQLILETALDLLAEHGYLGLNMDQIAHATEYAKGTIYHHFTSKEDLLMALMVKVGKVRQEYFSRALKLEGRTREQIMAIGVADELFIRLYPHYFLVERLVKDSDLASKVTEARHAEVAEHHNACGAVGQNIIARAIELGDLPMPNPEAGRAVQLALWAQSIGSHTLRLSSGLGEMLGDLDLSAVLWHNYNALLDGYRWRPLSMEHDYRATGERILKELFPEEHQRSTELGHPPPGYALKPASELAKEANHG